MLVCDDSTSNVCPRDSIRGMQSSEKAVAFCACSCVSISSFFDGLSIETSVRSPRSLTSSREGGRIVRTMWLPHTSSAVGRIFAPAAS
eukprot:5931912-Prymnesium_polylepis.1